MLSRSNLCATGHLPVSTDVQCPRSCGNFEVSRGLAFDAALASAMLALASAMLALVPEMLALVPEMLALVPEMLALANSPLALL